jgi:hypothetical protein
VDRLARAFHIDPVEGGAMVEKRQQDEPDRTDGSGQPQGTVKGDAPPPSPQDPDANPEGRDRPPAGRPRDRRDPWLGGG